jgi:hypothetical protein
VPSTATLCTNDATGSHPTILNRRTLNVLVPDRGFVPCVLNPLHEHPTFFATKSVTRHQPLPHLVTRPAEPTGSRAIQFLPAELGHAACQSAAALKIHLIEAGAAALAVIVSVVAPDVTGSTGRLM